MRVAFAGTPPFAASALERLHAAGHDLVGVLTQPDRPSGRGMKLQPSAVKQVAMALGIPVWQPRSLRLDGRWPDDAAQAREQLQRVRPDVLVVAAYGLILPAWVLTLPAAGCLNIHASLLPRWRGAAPIQRAIEAGDKLTGITIMQMDEGLDTGNILLVAPQPIHADDTSASLQDRLAVLGADLIVQTLQQLARTRLDSTPQPTEGVTYARKIEKAEASIDWRHDAALIERRVRAFDPFPGATFGLQAQSVKLWRARQMDHPDAAAAPPGTVLQSPGRELWVSCGTGSLNLLEMQAAGGRRMAADVFMQTPLGRTLQPGLRLDIPQIPA